jgi:hypothetical protein
MITKDEVLKAQKAWGDALVRIGLLKEDREACESFTDEVIDILYAYDVSEVLFKPTRAKDKQFRNTKEGAKSYFIGGNDDYLEDSGFALQPWSEVKFENSGIILEEKIALAMGNYYFTEKDSHVVKKVEYTFGYIKDDEGNLKINLHHSSVPFSPTI